MKVNKMEYIIIIIIIVVVASGIGSQLANTLLK